jgi:hypothetical protein
MKSIFVVDDLVQPGPVWLNTIWSFAVVAEEMVNASPFFIPHRGASSALGARHQLRREAADLTRNLNDHVVSKLDANGPNVLFVVAASHRTIALTRALFPVWDRFDKHVLMIEENLDTDLLPAGVFERFDLVTAFCSDLAATYRERLDIPAVYLPAHMDVLRFHSTSAFRPIDMAVVGRRHNDIHDPLFRHFNAAESRRLFIDFVTRTQMDQTLGEEFALLMNTYGRSNVAFGYEPSNLPRFLGRSPMTSRWVHAWAAGCTAIGRRPLGTDTAAQMDWPESIIEIPDKPEDAIALLESVLDDADGLARRRQRNVLEALTRHDSRHRLKSIFERLELPLPDRLSHGLAEISRLADTLLSEQPAALLESSSVNNR